jgi:predicted nuclease of predicted toxin-antitoxin system
VRWLADECVDAALVRGLRAAGHDVFYAAELASGSTDAEVIRRAQTDRRLLLMEDKDFGELVFRARMAVPGVVLLRLNPEQHSFKSARLEAAIAHFGNRLFGRYVVVEENRFRSRSLSVGP